MRNAILAAMAEVLVQVLSGDELEKAARGTRDKFLDMLQAHVCDVHSFVRSRVLQLFTRIVQNKASLCWPHGVASVVSSHLVVLREFLPPCFLFAEIEVLTEKGAVPVYCGVCSFFQDTKDPRGGRIGEWKLNAAHSYKKKEHSIHPLFTHWYGKTSQLPDIPRLNKILDNLSSWFHWRLDQNISRGLLSPLTQIDFSVNL